MAVFVRTLLLWGRRPGLVSKAAAATRQPAKYISSKPPKGDVRVVEAVGAMAVMCLAILGPSGWIAAHVHDYRKGGR